MSKRFRVLAAFLVLTIAILACAVPAIPPIGQPTQNNATAILPASPDPNQVGTAVAMTLTADVPGGGSTATIPETGNTATPAPGGSADLLPHTLYYLAPDSAGVTQIFRMERDGKTKHQVTSEDLCH